MQRINVNVRPSSGYVFSDTDGSTHRAKSWALVIVKVREYRERQGKNSETTESDVMTQACTRYPSLCRPPGDTRPAAIGAQPGAPERPQPAMTLKAHVLMWMARLFTAKQKGGHLDYVQTGEAQARKGVCMQCPYNTPFISKGCGSCKQITSDYRDGLIPGRPRFDGLGGCLLLGVDLVTSVHLDETRVVNNALPSFCWRKVAV